MTLYYSLVFYLLCFEVFIFVGLIMPLPQKARRMLFLFISESVYVAKLQYGLKIAFIGVLILFVDSLNRAWRVEMELNAIGKDYHGGRVAPLGGTERMEVQARKFYSQRNTYLCGSTLFLSLILNRQYVVILEVLRLQEENRQLKGLASADDLAAATGLHNAGAAGEIGGLRKNIAEKEKALEAKDRDFKNLQKQAANMNAEYNRLGDSVSTIDVTPKKDR